LSILAIRMRSSPQMHLS